MKYDNQNPLEKLHHGEPYFFIRAQDKLSVYAIRWYAENLQYHGDLAGRDEVRALADMFAEWQAKHPNLVKLPD